jgi:nitrate/TMAO reductase-like tetraheme cytochrome c subunit
MKKKFPITFYNPLTLAGAGLASISFGLILFLIILEAMTKDPKPYMGIIAFVLLPGFMIIGLLLVAYGIIREHKREKAGKSHLKFPKLDLNDPKVRFSVVVFSVGTILLLLFTAFGSFKAYEYTDSDEFCGTVCHKVMEPEYTAYKSSPHARVGCVKCHIGSGTEWYVRSKFSGAYQVYSVLFNKYARPIETPIRNLRPAQETCEQCHWPQHFFSEKKHTNTYYISDENNSKWTLTLSMKVGGGTEESGNKTGIHWHMNISNEITYMTTDRQRMVIPWVKVKSRTTGKETIYQTVGAKIIPAMFTPDNVRKMDCMDCHNRPSHQYNPPFRSVDHLMAANSIDPSLPYIKSISVQALENPYSDNKTAMDSIRIVIQEFYSANYPEIAIAKKDLIDSAISEVQKIYSRNYFPGMNVSWRYFPDQIGHMYSPGCFRCHDGKHVSSDGKVVPKDCNTCHTLMSQQFEGEQQQVSLTGIEYKHPVDIGNSWKSSICSDCHNRKK